MVEWKKLGEVCNIKNGYTPSTKNPYFWDNGNLPWFTLEDIRKNGRVLNDAIKHITPAGLKKGGLFPKDSVIISTTATIGEFALITTDFLCNQQITCISIKEAFRNILLPKFLFFLSADIGRWCKKNVNGGGSLQIISTSKLINLTIPVPSLEEQNRIVGILDTFTDSIENLKQQIAQRRKQYEFYRDQLLDLEGKEGVEMKTLGEICDIKGRIGFRGYTREDQVPKGEGAISLSPGNIINGRINYDTCTYITWKKYEESPEIMTYNNDIILCKTASVGKVAMITNLPEKATINPQLVVLKRIKVNGKFLYYLLSTYKCQSVLTTLAGVGSVPNISQAKLSNLDLYLPPLSEQSRIVSILDTFEASISNLEAQLEQRQKQYEYYRNQLLTFE